MSNLRQNMNGLTTLDIIAFQLGEQTFCIETTSVREIRGWASSTPLPHASPEVLGIINLRGTVIPTIDLSRKLGMRSGETTERSAIVVVEVSGMPLGLVVDQVTDMLSVTSDQLQPAPSVASSFDRSWCAGIITHISGMICFLDLQAMFASSDALAA
ncbi:MULTISPECIES: chemotaxis protein CheW [Rhizobium/Agrobacterium group]|uniref:Chemotaxis protein CheW n=1 Tax=Rhizobium rhizogenes TaxID=359 RepID=A0AA92HAY6_RHIRH|nr:MULTISPECIES: chemotaxis protein CheW [Rhizobium/Agrobacterium group]MQB21582.1 chemotaxis protein CheW [Agrobacterium tumefaciens]PVE56870.1 chemotaxis protein CheW [Rhizobium rhizogenes]PVE68619.1 chemotaxis protein CheW [Agrobacterium tumefaciens]PVE78367.1 chemotaxis protein CheW [Sphingomonas sp. TPD3009]